jgi:2-polyprenyl-6-methoxyphenol hydroxylase-like FAD-dependent oxidoreductase
MQTRESQISETQAEIVKKYEETTCCIVGGGPAGAMLALLLARKGVEVVLLEEHMDFARDFRGDTVHPSTMEVLAQIGMADRILQLEHTQAPKMVIETPQGVAAEISFQHLKTSYPYITLIPQVHFLECITAEAKRYPNFRLVMGGRVEKLVVEDGYVHGVQYRAPDGMHELRAVLTVGADGRFSRIRKLAGLEPVKSSQSMDVLWFRLPRQNGDPEESGGKLGIGQGHPFVQLDRGNEWQIGYTILKGSFQEIKTAGIERLRADIAAIVPAFAERMQTVTEWKQVSVLSVESSMVKCWYRPGLLLIGDAAHVMTPVGGVGINYAIQDAVAAANILTDALKVGKVSTADLARVQRRRERPTRMIQAFQRQMQKQVQSATMTTNGTPTLPLAFRLALHIPFLRNIPAKFIGFGPVRERVKNP